MKNLVKVLLISVVCIYGAGIAMAADVLVNPEVVKICIPVTIRPISIHKEVTGVYDDLNWGRYPTSLVCEIVNWELPAANAKNTRIIKYLEANKENLQAFVGGEMGGKNIKALGKVTNIVGSISSKIRIKGTLEVWTYNLGQEKGNPIRVRLIGINKFFKN